MAAPIVAHQRVVGRIFSNEYVFRIPNYQRPYAWTNDQASELFDDLFTAANANRGPIDDLPPYFLGSIVLIKTEELPNADVVDGQQRLTSLVLLLSAIRALIEGKDANDISALLYESGSRIMGTVDRFRLTLRGRDAEFFQKYVQKEGGMSELLKLDSSHSDSQLNIVKNAQLFSQRLGSLTKEERVRLAQFVVTRCYLVAVSTPDLDSAYRIFSVLNSRGLDLAATDILKAEVIGAIAASSRDAYTNKWETIEEDLGRESFNELFSHIRMVYRKAKPQGTLLKEFKEHVSSSRSPENLIDDVIVPMAEAYEFLTGASYESVRGAEAVNEPLKWLNKLEFVDWLPPALAFAIRHKNDPEKMVSFVADLERLGYGMLLGKFNVNERIERFGKITAAIEAGANLATAKSPLQLTPLEQLRVHDALSGPFFDTFAARVRTTVLLRLDALLSGGGATYDYPVITVEHVLPQNPKPDSDWVGWMPSFADRAECVHQLGNLALLTRKKNSSASNYGFKRKKETYFAGKGGISPFVLTTQILRLQTWTREDIAARQTALIASLERHWRLGDHKAALAPLID